MNLCIVKSDQKYMKKKLLVGLSLSINPEHKTVSLGLMIENMVDV